MLDVKRMTATEEILQISLKDKHCEVESYDSCRTTKLLEKCNCVPYALKGFLTNMVNINWGNKSIYLIHFILVSRQPAHSMTHVLRILRLTIISAWSHVKVSLLMLRSYHPRILLMRILSYSWKDTRLIRRCLKPRKVFLRHPTCAF